MSLLVNPYRFGAASSTLVQDTFTDTNGVAIADHDPDVDAEGGGWSMPTGTGFAISSNKLVSSSSSAVHAVIDAGSAGCIITYDQTFADTTNGRTEGCLGRYVDTSNFWILGIQSPNAVNPNLVIYETAATLRASVALTGQGPLTGETWPFTITLDGNDLLIETVINGTPYSTSYNSATYNTAEIHGLRSRNLASFDNFEINPLP